MTAGAALLGAIWEGDGHHRHERAFWLWLTLSLAAAPASAVSAVRMKRGHRAVLYGLNALCTAFLWLLWLGTGTPEDDFNLYFIFLVLVWLFALYGLGGARTEGGP